jgi:hypothetical protein
MAKIQTDNTLTFSALTGLETRILLVDDVYPALAAHQTVFPVTGLERLERILDLHVFDPLFVPLSTDQ